jgi:hypothetical protein
MREIELWTRDGNFVAVVDIPPFPDTGMPEVVMWGDRTFHNNAGHQTESKRWVYNEVFLVVSLTPSPGRRRPGEEHSLELKEIVKTEDLILYGPETRTLRGTPMGEHTDIGQDGMQKDYIVLWEHERAKGFVRPVRRGYIHKPELAGPKYPLRDLTPEEAQRYVATGYSKFEEYPKKREGGGPIGRFWKAEELARIERKCGALTTMGAALAETYARKPDFYSGTFCAHCKEHYPVGEKGEFVWDGTDERVGT